MICNYHTHTFRCGHARGEEREYIEKAFAEGLTTLGFSDHVPMPFPDGFQSHFRCKIEKLEDIRDDLKTDLEVKNNMLFIKQTAVEEYGMISGDYAASRYVDLTEDEKIEHYGEETAEESLLSQLLRAIGLEKDTP